jgi:Fe-S-cluster-containing hydrogenase component 2
VSEDPQASADAPDVTRRSMLKAAAPIVAFIALESIGGLGATKGPAPREVPLASGVVFPDPTLCIGCLTCEVICSQVHKEQGLSSLPRIRIFNDPNVQVDPAVTAAYPGRGSFHQEPCLQCPTAECLYVCPVNALRIEPTTGARYINQDVCVACNRCAEACIFPVSGEQNATNQLTMGQMTRITYDPEKDVFTKCDLCYWREGGPACVERCPVNVRIRQGVLKSDKMCLSAPAADPQTWDRLRSSQTFAGSPAKPVG